MRLKAYAKLNLTLRVFEKRPDGYHAIESVMQSVSLFDDITITPINKGIEVVCDDPSIPLGKDNLVYKAAELFGKKAESPSTSLGTSGEQKAERGVRIQIVKRIPVAAGLAGGSADAAAVLVGLNMLSNVQSPMSNVELMEIGARIGSDVPFCLVGGTCLVKGRGEIVDPLEAWPKTYFILVNPDLRVSAKWAYDEFDRLHLNNPEEIKNDLEPAVADRYAVIGEIKNKLMRLGCGEAQMSGSGPSVFGMVREKKKAEEVFARIKEDYPRAFLVENIGRGIEVVSQ